jgi:hypothetical protein
MFEARIRSLVAMLRSVCPIASLFAMDGTDSEEWEVEEIRGDRVLGSHKQYLIKWVGWPHEEWTEDWALDCPLSMQMYELKKKSRKEQEMTKDEGGTGFESISSMDVIRIHPPEIIVGFSHDATGKYYHVKCSGISHSLKVRSEVLRCVAPKLICEFLESRIQPQGRINSAQDLNSVHPRPGRRNRSLNH